jgi:hypothetical protein
MVLHCECFTLKIDAKWSLYVVKGKDETYSYCEEIN